MIANPITTAARHLKHWLVRGSVRQEDKIVNTKAEAQHGYLKALPRGIEANEGATG